MAGPSLSTLSELQEQLAKFRKLTDKELSKETACNVELVARYQKERELLRAEIDRQTPGPAGVGTSASVLDNDLQSLLDDMRTPSSFGNNIKRQKVLHESGDRLNCWRSRVRPLPLALLYSFFGTFSQACRRTAPLHERDKLFVLELCTEMREFAVIEVNREKSFGELIQQWLLGMLPHIQLQRQTRGKSVVDIQLRVKTEALGGQWLEDHVTLVYIEVKREAGSAGDAQQEGMVYYARDCRALGAAGTKTLQPALLLTVVGPTVQAFGLCLTRTGTIVCEPLTAAMDMLLIPHHVHRFEELVSFFRELPVLVSQLHEHYGTIAQLDTLPRFLDIGNVQLPSPLWKAEEWDDVKQIGAGKLVFRAHRKDPAGGQQVLVKLTQRYGTATHNAWAAAGLVPLLVDQPTQLPGGWQQIQMEYLPPVLEVEVSGWVTLSCLLNPLLRPSPHIQKLLPAPAARQSLVEKAQRLLEAAHNTPVDGREAAHGDARPDNILVLMRLGEVVDLKLVDLDWAGPAGEARYPTLLNTVAIQWPKGVAAGEPLQQAHDRQLLSLQTDPTTAASIIAWRRLTPPMFSEFSAAMETE